MGRKRATALQVLSLLEEYEEATGDKTGDYVAAAKWIHDNDKIKLRKEDPIKKIARMLARASGQDFITNEQNEPVRRRLAHPVPQKEGDSQSKQQVFKWFKIENATPEQMKMSTTWRRNGSLNEMIQLVRDVDYFNRHHNPGEPLVVDKNFTSDIDEARMPPEYPDAPPASDQPEE